MKTKSKSNLPSARVLTLHCLYVCVIALILSFCSTLFILPKRGLLLKMVDNPEVVIENEFPLCIESKHCIFEQIVPKTIGVPSFYVVMKMCKILFPFLFSSLLAVEKFSNVNVKVYITVSKSNHGGKP